MEIIKNTKNNGTLVFKEIDYGSAKKMMIENHYSKKWNSSFGKINVGVFRDNKLLGACVFGNLMNPQSYKKFNEHFTKDSVIELNRMWLDDVLGHNAETTLIGASFKILKKCYPKIKAVQSFADGRLGCGTIYKASNFKYFGFSKSLFFKDIETGEVFHKVPLENTKRPLGFIGKNLRYLDSKLVAFYVKTYKYIYILDKKISLNYKECPYPDYEKGEELLKYDHSIGLLCRLYLMIGKIDSNSRFLKIIIQKLSDLNYSDSDILQETKKQLNNESYIWFKNQYMHSQENAKKMKELIAV